MKFFRLIYLSIPLLMLSSCYKEDEKIIPHDPGEAKTATIEMMNDYRYQVYFDLGSGEAVSSNLKKTWDLAFDSSRDGWLILLNSSNFMLAARTGTTDFSIPIDTTGMDFQFDASSGNMDTLAIGKWVDFDGEDSVKIYTNEVYAIDRGYDEVGNLRGMRKIVFQEVTDTSYTFRFAYLDGSGENSFTVIKDPEVNYINFSFDNGGEQLKLEPPKRDWDLLFTQYTTLLYTNEGDPYPYLLTGVLSNPAFVGVAQDTLYDFSAIDRSIAETMFFTDILDEIGYDWKDVTGDVSSGSVIYVIVPGLNYVVRDTDGFLFKLRFVGFYDDSGSKGYPTFEYQLL
ncbi:MAG: hypothetical protein MUC31_07645 [Bacteroidales bacterium]|nr:hypothetical protein [Bacteroidales bacterium]